MRATKPFSWLPGVLAEIAEVAGLDAALAIAAARGGTEIYIPAQADDGHWLVAAVGREAADRICAQFAFDPATGRRHGVEVEIPLDPRGVVKNRALADRMIAEGRPASEIALAAGYTVRGIQMRRAIAAGRVPARSSRKHPSFLSAMRSLVRRLLPRGGGR